MGWYCPLIIRRRVNPVPATWIIATIAMNIATWSYNSIPGRSVIENASLYAAALEITLVTVVLLFVLTRAGELYIAFDNIQKVSLAIMSITVLYWAYNRETESARLVTYWTTQTLMTVAYIPTIVKVVRRGVAFDSIGNWGFIFLGSVIGTVPAVIGQNPYAVGNSLRAVLMSGITIGLLVYFDYRNGRERWDDEVQTLGRVYGF